MTSSPTRSLLATALLLLAAGCSFTDRGRLSDHTVGIVLLEGFEEAERSWATEGNRYWSAEVHSDGITVTNTPLGAGVSPVWYLSELPRNFEVRVRATLEKEGLDGGWGVEFGTKDRKFGYRALVYGSGRFCVDRLFDLYPEFIHCIPVQPEVVAGEATNVLSVKVEGDRIAIVVNGDEVVVFTDDRYEPGGFALAVAGAGTGVFFEDVVVLSLD
jgi:hypothetical protein